jgi:hypothetical protein
MNGEPERLYRTPVGAEASLRHPELVEVAQDEKIVRRAREMHRGRGIRRCSSCSRLVNKKEIICCNPVAVFK